MKEIIENQRPKKKTYFNVFNLQKNANCFLIANDMLWKSL